MRLWVRAALCAALVAAALVAAPPSAPAVEPLRILLVGDSVTQGSSGDWTWRYRLWQHFADAGVPVDFVGPRDDLQPLPGEGPEAPYADPAFDRDHAARWGMWALFPDVPLDELVATYRPDVVVEALGVNDLLQGVDPAEVSAAVGRTVLDARTQRPDVAFVLAETSQHWFAGVPELNTRLAGVADELTTPGSPVVVAHLADGYDAERDTWDGSHPNARGEVRIAAAVADALHALGVGPAAARPLALPPVGPQVPATVTARAGDGQVELTWTGAPGTTGQVLWGRDVTLDQAWTALPQPVAASGSWTGHWLVNGHTYAYRLQPMKGDDLPDGEVYSSVVTAVPTAPPPDPPDPPGPPDPVDPATPPTPATPAAPAAPASVLDSPARLRAAGVGSRCVRLRWRAVPGATSYLVEARTAKRWSRPVTATASRWRATRLPARRTWRFRVRAVSDGVAGPPARLSVRPARSAGPCR
ncbi:GDSL-type esterase/lipase family protein [Nocardioides humi]|uniref:Fibronectin type-III domain-containing protein n=1 Tax=Nocardioides humi TaxID=449461 RepID=A0ABN2BLR3_9ACTN|nr:GDSL-type esterase/lipase family protein [Nocardioides humi]